MMNTPTKLRKLGTIIFALLGEFITIYSMPGGSASIGTTRHSDPPKLMLVLNDGLDCKVSVNGEEIKGETIHCHGKAALRGMTKLFGVVEGDWVFNFENIEVVHFKLVLQPTEEQKSLADELNMYVNLCYRMLDSAESISAFINLILLTPKAKVRSVFRKRIKTVFEKGIKVFGPSMTSLLADSIRSAKYTSHEDINSLIDFSHTA